MDNIKANCSTCKHDFWIIKQEQDFLKKMNLPFPTNCPGCRETRRIKERGERNLYRTTCKQCSANIIVTYDPQTETRTILCKKCYLDWFEKNPVIMTS